ncbi:ATP-binding protein [Mobilicoccus sp.]|uniref:sensor histidine kinase n=1 Tax=Mobilicoccus sp. TaxID=2034349 RepID=UPI0028AFDA51|nr:ATP-binding protein [Mobilicoccus sp.]
MSTSDRAREASRDAAVVLDSLPDGVVVVGPDRRVEVVNPRAAQLLGRRAEDVVGTPVAEALPLLDTAGHPWWDVVDPWGGLDIRTGHRERMLLLPGRGRVLVTMSFVREAPRGAVVRVVVALRDTDARRRADAETSELISLVAHELRAPLASVKGFSTTLLRRWDRFTDAQKHLMIETIEADADRLARLIHELLDVSRLDTSHLRLERRRVDLVAIVRRCVARLVATGLDEDRFDVRIDVPDGEADAWADADRLDQVVTNLLENAVRHGAGTVHVRVAADRAEDGTSPTAPPRWVVSVADEGEGVRPEHYARVFSKFWHGSRRGSTGLGLYLVRGLVEAHGGSVSVDRAPEGGALFRFTLPAAPDRSR